MAKSKKKERCIQHVKRQNRKKTGNEMEPANPFAVCNASIKHKKKKGK